MSNMWTECQIESALCLWEYSLECRFSDDDSVFDWLRGGEGAAAARQQCIMLAQDLDASYHLANELGYDTSFDWEFVPRWTRLAMKISALGHDLTRGWINYIGREIYREFRLDNKGVPG